MSRVIIHPSVKNEYLKKLINKTENLKIGPGSDNNSEVTPLISKEQLKRVSNYCYSGIQSGANLAFGGNELNYKNGNYQKTNFCLIRIIKSIKPFKRVNKKRCKRNRNCLYPP